MMTTKFSDETMGAILLSPPARSRYPTTCFANCE